MRLYPAGLSRRRPPQETRPCDNKRGGLLGHTGSTARDLGGADAPGARLAAARGWGLATVVVTGSRAKTRRCYGQNAAEIAQLGCPRVGQRPALPSESGLWAPGGRGGTGGWHSGACLSCTATCAGGFPAHRGAARAAAVTGRPGPLRARSYNVCKVACNLRGAWALWTMRPGHSEPWLPPKYQQQSL